MKLSLVVPCYNEEKNVAAFYEAVKNVFNEKDYDYEIVFVNDGSTDGTLYNLKQLHDTAEENIRIVSFSRNFGKESALYAGLEHSEGDYICLIDADLQQRPEIAASMVDKLDSNPQVDCVAAFQSDRSEGAVLNFCKDGFYKLINKMSSTQFMRGASDFRTFRRNVAESVLSMGEYHRFSKGLLSWVGYNTMFIPYKAEERNAGESKWSFKKLFKYAMEGIMGYSVAPLTFSIALGLPFSAIGLIAMIVFAVRCMADPENFTWPAVVFFMLLLSTGLILTALGVIGAYLAKIYEQGKNRPIYIAKEIIEPKSKDETD